MVSRSSTDTLGGVLAVAMQCTNHTPLLAAYPNPFEDRNCVLGACVALDSGEVWRWSPPVVIHLGERNSMRAESRAFFACFVRHKFAILTLYFRSIRYLVFSSFPLAINSLADNKANVLLSDFEIPVLKAPAAPSSPQTP